MAQGNIEMTARVISPKTSVIDINGDFTAAAESALMDSYTRACAPTTRTVIFNFSGLEYMNSSGIGLLVTFLIRANRQKQKVLAYGLSDHYRHIFELTRLNEAIHVYDNELAAIDAA